MIRAEELSIGDWVNVLNYHWDGRPYTGQVKGITKKHGTYYLQFGSGLFAEIDRCEPIPITMEILEKNGFVIKKKWAQMGNFGNSPLIMWHFEDEPILRDFKHELEIHQNDTGKVHIQIPCEYVHQLQHALKLCGTSKNIEP